ncbi:hypothetical protein AB0K09_30590, partial [Streptomyces sp. NPDC049577]|uniref:hypothetical protein n=1 Tax=Streptomyces sp. NPDC049577 TaxID=3155153 RepID=UPI00343254AC
MNGRRADAEEALVRIRDLAGRARGTGFLADDRGTLVTSHEAVDGLARLVLYGPGDLTDMHEGLADNPVVWQLQS